MKVFISFDIEGVSGLTDESHIDENSPNFEIARRLSTGDVNAAVEGAVAAGASEVVIYDGHGFKRNNIIFEKLHPKARLVRGRLETPGFNMLGLDDTFAAVFFIGWHSRPSMPGVLSHCYHPEVFAEWRANGKPVGEGEFSAAFAGLYDLPVVLFSGDDCSCAEVKKWNPECECVITKEAIDRQAALCYPTEVTWENIRQAAKRAVENRAKVKPFNFQMPVCIEADTFFDHQASAITLIPGVERIGPRTIQFQSNDYREAFNALLAMTLISIIAK